jgi:hypothetical protein
MYRRGCLHSPALVAWERAGAHPRAILEVVGFGIAFRATLYEAVVVGGTHASSEFMPAFVAVGADDVIIRLELPRERAESYALGIMVRVKS